VGMGSHLVGMVGIVAGIAMGQVEIDSVEVAAKEVVQVVEVEIDWVVVGIAVNQVAAMEVVQVVVGIDRFGTVAQTGEVSLIVVNQIGLELMGLQIVVAVAFAFVVAFAAVVVEGRVAVVVVAVAVAVIEIAVVVAVAFAVVIVTVAVVVAVAAVVVEGRVVAAVASSTQSLLVVSLD